jgi:hypothetical protein
MSFGKEFIFSRKLTALYCSSVACDTQYYKIGDWRTQSIISEVKSSAACADQIYIRTYLRTFLKAIKSEDDNSLILSAASSLEMTIIQQQF